MANSLAAYNTFTARTLIESAKVNENFATIKNASALWQKYTVSYAAFAALGATATGQLTLCAALATEVHDAFIVKHDTLFTGTSITAAVSRIGLTGNDGYFTDDFDVNQAVSADAKQITHNPAFLASATSIMIRLSLSGGLLNQLSQGSINVYIRRAEIP